MQVLSAAVLQPLLLRSLCVQVQRGLRVRLQFVWLRLRGLCGQVQ